MALFFWPVLLFLRTTGPGGERNYFWSCKSDYYSNCVASAAANYKHLSVIAISELAQISRRSGRTGVKPQKFGPSALAQSTERAYIF